MIFPLVLLRAINCEAVLGRRDMLKYWHITTEAPFHSTHQSSPCRNPICTVHAFSHCLCVLFDEESWSSLPRAEEDGVWALATMGNASSLEGSFSSRGVVEREGVGLQDLIRRYSSFLEPSRMSTRLGVSWYNGTHLNFI